MTTANSYDMTIRQWVDTGALDVAATVRPEATPLARDEALRSLGLQPASGAETAVAVFEAIGKGGMATVHRGQQGTLGRDVAIKIQKNGLSPAQQSSMLHEACLTGALEHPNIVPIYELVIDQEGRPMVLMRRIEGTSWGELFTDPERVRRDFQADDVVEWHMRVFIQVCNAVDYAHSVGVIHRDIKPENVMIGGHGEVYLLDWGIATATRGPLAERLRPLASSQLAGTPCYLAPEMLEGELDLIDERTDVYLLGASLYHAMAGAPPHPGTSISAVLDAVVNRDVSIPDSLPSDLQDLLRRTLHRDPAKRPQTAIELRRSVEKILTHRSSNQLCGVADESFATLTAALVGCNLRDHDTRAKVYRLYTSCRGAYQGALHLWPDSSAARSGLLRATEALIDAEIETGTSRAATALVAEIEDPPERLLLKVSDALETEDRDFADMQQMATVARSLSSVHEARLRAILILCFTGAFAIYVGVFQEQDMKTLASVDLGGLLAIGGYILATKLRTMKSAFNRRAISLLSLVIATFFIRRLIAVYADIPGQTILAQDSIIYFMTMMVASVALDRRLWPTAVVYGIGHIFVLLDPSHISIAAAVGHGFLAVYTAYIWWPRPERESA